MKGRISTEDGEDFSELFSGEHFFVRKELNKRQQKYGLGVKPKVMVQKLGQAITMHAGCFHQVRDSWKPIFIHA